METSLIELLTYYVVVSLLFVGAPGVFFFIVFMPALQNTKGRMVGYKDHKTCLLYTSPSPRDAHESRMPSSA